MARPNRFIATVKVGDQEVVTAHVPNTGRMKELLVPGAPVLLAYQPSPKRKTDYTLLLIKYQGVWVGIHSTMANAIGAAYMASLPGVENLRREVSYGNSRFDLAFDYRGVPALYEVKSANLVVNHTAMFPDAPTVRGSKHLKELMKAQEEGYHGGILFVVQRNDAQAFTPNADTDPEFAQNLRRCAKAGLDIRALRCTMEGDEITIENEIPVHLALDEKIK